MQPNSALTPYLTASQFLLLRDIRTIVQYCSDDPRDGFQSASISVVRAALTDPTTPVGGVLLQKLMAASGMLESALLRSGRYTAADLLALAGNSAVYMQEVLAALTMYKIATRRPGPELPASVTDAYNEAIKALNDLSEGIRIFAFAEVEAAAVPAVRQSTIIDHVQNNMITARWRPMFADRQINKRFGGWVSGWPGCNW
jgi:hypothetical protein